MCDLFDRSTTPKPATTTSKHIDNDCTEAMQAFPMPGDCHKYYICLPTETENVFDITVRILMHFYVRYC